MRTIVVMAVLIGLALSGAILTADEKPKVAALPPHPLDAAFNKADTEKTVSEAIMKNDLFKKAVKEALASKKKQEEAFKKNPNFVGPTPAQAARVKFLEVLGKAKADD